MTFLMPQAARSAESHPTKDDPMPLLTCPECGEPEGKKFDPGILCLACGWEHHQYEKD